MKIKALLIIYFLLIIPIYCWGISEETMEDSIRKLNNTGAMFFFAGDYEKAEVLFIKSLKIRKEIYPENHIEIAKGYNNLGVLKKNKWQYEFALEYLNKAKSIYDSKNDKLISIATVYSNIGNVYHHKGDYLHAEDYYNKSLEIIEGEKSSLALQRKAEVLNRYALLEIERRKYFSAIKLITKGINEYKKVKNTSNVTMHNLLTTAADAYNLSNNDSCLHFIQESIELFMNNDSFSKHLKAVSYRKLSEYYLKNKQLNKAIYSIKLAETLFENSSIDSVYYFEIVTLYANYYELKGEYKNAINYYNKANQLLLYKKDSIADQEYASVIKGIELLKNKSNCLINWYYTDRKKEHLAEALVDLKTVTKLIDKARSGYLSIESKLLLAESEGSIYEMGIMCSHTLYSLTQQTEYIEQAFYFAEKGKSSVLLDALNEEKAKSFAEIPDSLLQKEQNFKRELAFYKEKIYEEGLKTQPDSLKLRTWKNYLFKFSQENEQLTQLFEKQYPEYYNFKYQNKSVNIHEIQKSINKNSTLIEYAITDSILYTFVINKSEISLFKTTLSEEIFKNINSFLSQFKNFDYTIQGSNIYKDYENNAYEIYNKLLGYINPELLNNSLVIIPDGILSYIPFEALVYNASTSAPTSFGKLDYLLYKHSIYYSYSAALFSETQKQSKAKIWNNTLAIAPDYNYTPNNTNYRNITSN